MLGIAALDPTYHENTGDCVGWVEQSDTQHNSCTIGSKTRKRGPKTPSKHLREKYLKGF